MPSIFVDTIEQLKAFLNRLEDAHSRVPEFFIDLEGHNISSGGALSLLQVLVMKEEQVYLIDLVVLGKEAFSTSGSSGVTLRSILESSTRFKAFFDVRTDSYALHRHFGIRLAGVHDIQLMAFASGRQSQRHVNGFAKCIEYDLYLLPAEKKSWLATKATGKKLFGPEFGGSYAVFDERPLSDTIKMYCSQDVLLLPALWLHYYKMLSCSWFDRVLAESEKRIRDSQQSTFHSGRHMAIGPTSWMAIRRESVPPNPTPSQAFERGCRELKSQLQPTTLTANQKNAATLTPSRPTNSNVETLFSGLSVANMKSSKADFQDFEDNFENDSDDGGLFDCIEHIGAMRAEAEADDAFKDYTACSGDDCGWCGNCDY